MHSYVCIHAYIRKLRISYRSDSAKNEQRFILCEFIVFIVIIKCVSV